MKRRITADQLKELTSEQQEKLRDWWKPEEGDIFNSSYGLNIHTSAVNPKVDEYAIPLLDIGQMIELLDPKEETIFTMCNFIAATPRIYQITVNGNNYFGDSMCDALWSAVKTAL